ncbi:Uncharacterised protein [Mycobacteroides abscessus subsp. massiliense]|nr:Uncharacterised protein [Mycobacteroides abscessus subsp. massiliense]
MTALGLREVVVKAKAVPAAASTTTVPAAAAITHIRLRRTVSTGAGRGACTGVSVPSGGVCPPNPVRASHQRRVDRVKAKAIAVTAKPAMSTNTAMRAWSPGRRWSPAVTAESNPVANRMTIAQVTTTMVRPERRRRSNRIPPTASPAASGVVTAAATSATIRAGSRLSESSDSTTPATARNRNTAPPSRLSTAAPSVVPRVGGGSEGARTGPGIATGCPCPCDWPW